MVRSVNGFKIPDFAIHNIPRKSRLNSLEIKRAYSFLVKLYGEICGICGNPPDENSNLDIEHIDENPFNHYWKNLQLAHHNCNCKKRSDNPNKRKGRIKIPISNEMSFQNGETQLKKTYLISFLNFIEQEFDITDQYNYKELINDACLICGMASEETIKRYLRMLCSPKANLLQKFTDERTGIDYVRKIGSFENFKKNYSW